VPVSPDGSRGLVDYLRLHGFDVWSLDWRVGKIVAGDPRFASPIDRLTLDTAAQYDLPRAVDFIRHASHSAPLAIVGHCLGGAVVAMAIGAGYLTANHTRKIVLTSMGLFYDVSWEDWVKADDQALERTLIDAPGTTAIHCDAATHPWPHALEDAYQIWPTALLPREPQDHPFSRLTFMFGRPFLEGIVNEGDRSRPALLDRFGAMPVAAYIHCCQNVRRGFAAPYNDTSWSAAKGEPGGATGALDEDGAGRYLHVERFGGMRVTLITGELNPLWHPDSIRRMYEWLRRNPKVEVSKAVLAGYGHQDLYWARNAAQDVYPRILAGIAR
jgi:hypothetical protein